LVVLAVIGLHAGVTRSLSLRMAEFSAAALMPRRMEVVYVREMALSAPPATPTPVVGPLPGIPSKPVSRKVVKAPTPAASAARAPSEESQPPSKAASAPEEQAPLNVALTPPEAPSQPMPALPDEGPQVPEVQETPSLNTAGSADPTSAAPAFSWPASTRLSYILTGNYRGELHGSAQVEWVRIGTRYQVHLDVSIGSGLITRRMSSEGEITSEGLTPERYDEENKAFFRAPRRRTMRFETDAVVLANGERSHRLPGTQDTASQFVQLTYLFASNPGVLTPGNTVEVPLALPRHVSRWVYDVLAPTTLSTPFGAVEAFHLKPRRAVMKNDDLSFEVWVAPQLQYLPVRIRITQDEETYLDLVISRRPELAAS
jgi:hypothetical protein